MPDRYGPLVYRSVRYGALLLIAGVLAFFAGTAVAWIGYGSSYDLAHNHISDLGAVECGMLPGAGAEGGYVNPGYVCSPWHAAFNAGSVSSGILILFSLPLIWSAFRPRRSRSLGLGFLAVAAAGGLGVGVFPEDVNLAAHTLGALFLFLAGNLALLVLGLAMFRDSRWGGYRAYTMVSGLVGLLGFGLYLGKLYGPLGVGGMEWLIVAPLFVWGLVAGAHLVRIPLYRGESAPPGFAGEAPR